MTLDDTVHQVSATQNSDDVGSRIRSWILDNFPLARERGIGETDSLLESGIIDSLGTLELISFLERAFDFVIADEDMLADHFESIASITAFVRAKRAV